MKFIGVILSYCDVFAGSKLYETVLTLLAIERPEAKALCFAPGKMQPPVINNIPGKEMSGVRNVLVESSRRVRSKVFSVKQAEPIQMDALNITGGFGTAKNLSSFANKGQNCDVDEESKKITPETYKQNKPINFICIASAFIPKLLNADVRLTIGTDSNMAEVIESMGAFHVPGTVNDIVVDKEHKIVTTSAYMLVDSIDEAASGIDKRVKRVVEMIA